MMVLMNLTIKKMVVRMKKNLSHIIYDPIKSLLVDIFQRFATVKLLQVAELHVHLLFILR